MQNLCLFNTIISVFKATTIAELFYSKHAVLFFLIDPIIWDLSVFVYNHRNRM